jgi:hypothetical protein
MSCQVLADNLCRWQQSNQPQLWVEWHRGAWDHADWLSLLEALRESEFGPLDPEGVGRILEARKAEWHNLRRWRESGAPRRWVEAHQGRWNHADWVALLEELRQSDFWPLDPAAVARVVEELKTEWHNLRRWEDSGMARQWVQARGGEWGHADWLALLKELRRSEFWPLQPDAVGTVLERLKTESQNLCCWRESGEPREWVGLRQGEWDHAAWLSLLETLEESAFWPMEPAAVGRVLEELKHEWHTLVPWHTAGESLSGGTGESEWNYSTWLGLLENFEQSTFWPVEPGEDGQSTREGHAPSRLAA